MKSMVSKWGNSLAIRIPQHLAEKLGLKDGSKVEMDASEDGLLIKKPKYTLEEMLSQITDENRHEETDWGPPAGREIW